MLLLPQRTGITSRGQHVGVHVCISPSAQIHGCWGNQQVWKSGNQNRRCWMVLAQCPLRLQSKHQWELQLPEVLFGLEAVLLTWLSHSFWQEASVPCPADFPQGCLLWHLASPRESMWKQPCLLWLILSHLPCPVLNNESTLKLHPHSKGRKLGSTFSRKAYLRICAHILKGPPS